MTDASIYSMDYDVNAGKKANMKLEIKKSWLDNMGISKLNNLDILIWAYDNDKSFKEFDTGVIHLGDTSTQTVSGDVVYASGKLIVKYIGKDGQKIKFSVKSLYPGYNDVELDNISINDFSNGSYYYWGNTQILYGCERVLEYEVENSFMEDNGLTSISEFTFTIESELNDDYRNKEKTEEISIKV